MRCIDVNLRVALVGIVLVAAWNFLVVLNLTSSINTGEQGLDHSLAALDTVKNSRNLLLSVPFYVYEDLAWVNATIGGQPILDVIGPGKHQKHSNDYWFMMASLRHPLRTRDPTKAKLFVIPTLLNMYSFRVFRSDGRNVTMCWKGMCDRELLKHAGRSLNATSYIHTHPHLHLVTTSHYGYHLKNTLNMPALLRQALYRCNSITFEQKVFNDPTRIRFPSYLVGNACPTALTLDEQTKNKVNDIVMIGTLKPNDKRFQDRQNLCEWLSTSGNAGETKPAAVHQKPLRVPICGEGYQCPALGDSKLGLHVRGDTFGSQRLMDTILSGTVPVFTRREQFLVQPPWIDWEQLSYFVDMEHSDKVSTMALLKDILEDTESYQRKLGAVWNHRQLFNWSTPYPFDTYMYMLQASLYPKTRRNHTQWAALRLPPMQ